MTVASRVSERFLDQETARRVAHRVLFAMSDSEAKKVLKFHVKDRPTREEINDKFRALVKQTIQQNPGAGADQAELRDLNIAKSTLLGELDRANWRPEDEHGNRAPVREVRKKEWTRVPNEPDEPPPVPEGEPFAAAMSGLGHVEWKIMTDGEYKYDVLVEPDGPGKGLVVVTAADEVRRKVYFANRAEFILIGRDANHYVFGKLIRRHNSRSNTGSAEVVRWLSSKEVYPLSKDLLKLAPKVVKELRGKGRRVAKFKVIEGTLTENDFKHFRGTLSLPDAISGSGILAEGADTSALQGRKTQVEIEPILNKEKWKAWKANPALRADEHLAYDWVVYINGKKHALSENEVVRLKKNYFLFALYSYDYQGKKNLTRLKGGGFKMPAKEALEKLAEGLDSGPVKSTVESAAARAA